MDGQRRRGPQDWYMDGSFELSMAGFFLLLAVLFNFADGLRHAVLGELLAPFFLLIVVGGAWLVNQFVQRLKERLNFSRRGAVSHRQALGRRQARQALLGSLAGLSIVTVTGWLVARQWAFEGWMTLLHGFLFGLAMALFARALKMRRFFLLAVLSLVISIVISMLGLEHWDGVALLYAVLGGLVLFTGLCVLRTQKSHQLALGGSDGKP